MNSANTEKTLIKQPHCVIMFTYSIMQRMSRFFFCHFQAKYKGKKENLKYVLIIAECYDNTFSNCLLRS